MAGCRQRRRQIDRGRGLADAALLIGDGDDPGAMRDRNDSGPASTVGEAHGQPVASEERPPADRKGSGGATHVIVQRLRARVNSSVDPLALGKQADRCRGRETAAARSSNRSSGAQARAVTTSTGCGGTASTRQGRSRHGSLGHARGLAQKRALFANPPRPARHRATPRIASTSPGKPGAAAEIDQALRPFGTKAAAAAPNSRMCRRHRSAIVSRPTRLMRADHRVSSSA